MSGRQSRGRRQEAVNAEKANVFEEDESMPNHFDERQQRIYKKYVTRLEAKCRMYEMWDYF